MDRVWSVSLTEWRHIRSLTRGQLIETKTDLALAASNLHSKVDDGS